MVSELTNPFQEDPHIDVTDQQLVAQALEGSGDALEKLVAGHQAWLFNIAVRMVWNATDAEDVVQEVMIKAVTKLSTFRGESSFRTWLYRIACNHVLNMKRRTSEEQLVSFSQFSDDLDRIPDRELPDPESVPVDLPVLVEEAKLGCLSAMLLGLDRRQRLAYTLVELLGASSQTAAELMEITPANLRQIVHRARQELYQFMNGNCGLVNKDNRCRCAAKTPSFIDAGYVEPANIRFADASAPRLDTNAKSLEVLESRVDQLHREQQQQARFMTPPDAKNSLMRFLSDPAVRETLCLD